MPDTPLPPQFSWTCPECARKVPNRLEECRCGFVRNLEMGATMGLSAVAPGAKADATGASGAGGRSTSWLPWIVLGIVAAAAAGTLIALQVIPARREIQRNAEASTAPSASAFAPDGATTDRPLGPNAPIAPDAPDAPFAPDAPNAPFAPNAPLAPNAPVAPSAPFAPTAPVTAGPSLEDIVSRSIPAIVSIETREGRGSGFFAAPRTVITNRHVVQENVSVTVRLSTGQALPGRVDVSSREYDLAIVRVDSASPSQAVLPLGTANDVRQGQEVIAIGLALGVFQNSVTRGIISAVRRTDRTVLLQTDAAINPGNSGGPLMNRQGEVVGINTMKIAGAAESLGFAVAVDHARGMLSGGRQSDTPLSTTAPVTRSLAPAFSTGSTIDAARADGTRRYDQIVEAVARQAAQLDGYWNRIKSNCAVRVAPGYDREWFGLWDGRTVLTGPDASCAAAARDLSNMAAELRAAMSAAQEEARRASVLPGQMRDIRRRYRMDWAGWER
jgi:S1-C subfamily serine protease